MPPRLAVTIPEHYYAGFVVVFFFFFKAVSLCTFDCTGIHSVDQAGLELRDSPASASQVLGLKACTIKATLKRGWLIGSEVQFIIIKAGTWWHLLRHGTGDAESSTSSSEGCW